MWGVTVSPSTPVNLNTPGVNSDDTNHTCEISRCILVDQYVGVYIMMGNQISAWRLQTNTSSRIKALPRWGVCVCFVRGGG